MTTTANQPATTDVTMVNLTIDGLKVSVPQGTLVIRAAETVGIQIPRFCDHPLLDPIGACRQCLVEIEMGGRPMPKPQAACTIEVAEGMVVRTQLTSEVAERAQEGIMELLLINHPLDCPVCDKGGECPLQNQAMSSGRPESRFIDVKRTYPKPINISTQILLDRERCVLCARCTRFSQQIAGDPFIELFDRGALEQVAIYEDEPFQSYFSGNTVQICPVGALTSADYRFRSRPFDLQSTPSTCEHCASGCAIRTDWRRGKTMRRLAGNDPEVNQEWTCDKGRFAFAYAQDNSRILEPMIRDEDGNLVTTSWPEALEVAAKGLRAARDAGGVGVLPGGRLTLEDAYAYSKFARVALGTNDIDSRARAHSDEELEFLATHVAAVGPADGAVTYADLDRATSVVLVGFDPEEESPIIFTRLRRAVRQGELAVYSVAPYATWGLQKLGGKLIATQPGAEASVLGAIADRTAGGFGKEIADGLGAGCIVLAGERLAEMPGALRGVAALGAAGARIAWVPRRAGERSGIDAGTLPSLLPGGRLVADVGARAELETVWGTSIPGEVGRDLTGILQATRDGEIAGLLFGGVDATDLPDPQLALEAMRNSKFVVSIEQRPSSVTEWADVVLPIAPVVEKSGSFISWEGRRRKFDLTIHSTGALPDSRVLHSLADEMDVNLGLPVPDAVVAEIERLGTTDQRPTAEPATHASPPPAPQAGSAILASWHQLLDDGTLQEGEQYLAGTQRAPVVRLSPATAQEVGVVDGELVTVSSPHGAISLPLIVTEMTDRVAWVPMKSPGSWLRRDLQVPVGSVVQISAGGAK
ncbi:NADH-quinone oxidoreductase subunit G [Epidermidibacterium keratini]|uniref:NADH-quinone oxidoreductase n=1 Tax=Epidermidibacterium keratini TaxID=1891644 RepID=A0A7L4YKH1_9ACTN|nr:NADH-quinone oxidoreductase subunit G [Epidermidibacterium keratini]QHB99750.1 NADH-quinone oxidoreductase subunit G [Epidermidibacterium keratini]